MSHSLLPHCKTNPLFHHRTLQRLGLRPSVSLPRRRLRRLRRQQQPQLRWGQLDVLEFLRRRHRHLPLHACADVAVQARPRAQRRPQQTRGALHHLPRHRLAVPHLAVLVRLHLRRQDLVLVARRRGRRARLHRSAAVPEHAVIHHGFISERSGISDRGVPDPEFPDRGRICAHRDRDV